MISYTELKWKRYTTIIYILWQSLDKKYLLKLNNVSQTSSKRFVDSPPIFLIWCPSYAPLSVKSFIYWFLLLRMRKLKLFTYQNWS